MSTGRVVVVVGCGKTKRRLVDRVVYASTGMLACWTSYRLDDLYVGNLFRARLSYARQLGGDLRIVSAFHGWRCADFESDPYDRCLTTMSAEARNIWNANVLWCADQDTAPGDRVVVLASGPYADGWCARLAARGRTVERPLAGMGIGEQLGWLKRAIAQAEAA